MSELNKTVMTAGVYTEEGVEVTKCEDLSMAEFSARERNGRAQKMGLGVRYVARSLDKTKS